MRLQALLLAAFALGCKSSAGRESGSEVKNGNNFEIASKPFGFKGCVQFPDGLDDLIKERLTDGAPSASTVTVNGATRILRDCIFPVQGSCGYDRTVRPLECNIDCVADIPVFATPGAGDSYQMRLVLDDLDPLSACVKKPVAFIGLYEALDSRGSGVDNPFHVKNMIQNPGMIGNPNPVIQPGNQIRPGAVVQPGASSQ